MSRKTRSSTKTVAAPDNEMVASDKYRTMIVPRNLLNEEGNSSLAKLRNPKTADGELYLFSGQNENLYQLVKFYEEPSSWFIDDRVIEDGSITYATEMDPLFLILPYLSKAEKFQPLDNLLVDAAYPECHRLLSCSGLQHIEQVADLKESGSLKAYSFNATKCLEWLSHKVNALVPKLKTAGVHVASGSRAATFVSSKKEVTSDEDYIRYAHGMISEYLSSDMSKSLLNHLGIKSAELEKATEEDEAPPTKRSKVEGGDEPVEDYSKSQKAQKPSQPQKLTAVQKSLSKVNKSSMKTISSFFARRK